MTQISNGASATERPLTRNVTAIPPLTSTPRFSYSLRRPQRNEMSQRPLFGLLGTPSHQKRHARLDGGHIPTDRRAVMREVLDWLDHHLGPVRRATSVAGAAPAP